MEIHYTTHQLELTQALKDFIADKMQRLLHRDATIDKLNISLRVENITHLAEGDLRLNGHDIHATAKSSDMYETIDILVDKLVTQITKLKEKSTNHHPHHAKDPHIEPNQDDNDSA